MQGQIESEDGADTRSEASARLEVLLRQTPAGGMNAQWLLSHLSDRSPEVIFLMVTPAALMPATSTFAGALLLIVAVPMIFHRRDLFLPRALARRTIPAALFKPLLNLLKRYEAYAMRHPHPPARHHTRLVGLQVTALSAALLVPLPFSNMLPGLTIGTVALASLEQDGKLLAVGVLLTVLSTLLISVEALTAYNLAAALF